MTQGRLKSFLDTEDAKAKRNDAAEDGDNLVNVTSV
jgi:hypothetical protein